MVPHNKQFARRPSRGLLVGCLLLGLLLFALFIKNNRTSTSNFRLVPFSACGSAGQSSWTAVDPIQLAECIERVVPDLPLNPARQCTSAFHHWDARTGKWNEGIRFQPLPGTQTDKISAVHYMGGNKQAADLQRLQALLPGRPVHIVEPVPSFFVELESRFKGQQGVVLHNVGMANSTRKVMLPKSALRDRSTVVMGSSNQGSGDVLNLVGPTEFLATTRFDVGKDLALLHVNCEGCEYEMLEAILDAGLISSYPVIQISFHYVPQVAYKLSRYCSIRVRLERTHQAVVSMPYGWERFVRRDFLV